MENGQFIDEIQWNPLETSICSFPLLCLITGGYHLVGYFFHITRTLGRMAKTMLTANFKRGCSIACLMSKAIQWLGRSDQERARGIHIPNKYSLFNGEPVGATESFPTISLSFMPNSGERCGALPVAKTWHVHRTRNTFCWSRTIWKHRGVLTLRRF